MPNDNQDLYKYLWANICIHRVLPCCLNVSWYCIFKETMEFKFNWKCVENISLSSYVYSITMTAPFCCMFDDKYTSQYIIKEFTATNCICHFA